jgi:hypothetical protein
MLQHNHAVTLLYGRKPVRDGQHRAFAQVILVRRDE